MRFSWMTLAAALAGGNAMFASPCGVAVLFGGSLVHCMETKI